MDYVYLLVECDPTYNTSFNMGCYATLQLVEHAKADRTEELQERLQAVDRGLYYVIERLPLYKEPA